MTDRRQRKCGTGSACARAVAEVLESRQLLTAELLKDVNDVGGDGLGLGYEMIEYEEELYFFPQSPGVGTELWRSDGTRFGTTMVKEIVPGPGGISPADVEVANGLLFFIDGSTRTLWRSDGTEDGTYALAPARGGGSAPALAVTGSAVVFVNDDGTELWTTDGTTGGTRRILDMAVQPQNTPLLGGLTSMGSQAYFWMKQPTGQSYTLWRTDGVAGAERADDAATFTVEPRNLTPVLLKLHFVADGGDLFVYDAATDRITALSPPNLLAVQNLFASGQSLFFTGTTIANGAELWGVSYGDPTTTRMVMDLVPGAGSSNPAMFALSGPNLYFVASDAAGTQAIYRYDGPTSTRIVDFTAQGGRPVVRAMTGTRPWIFIAVENDAVGDSVWFFNGTAENTIKVAQMPPDALTISNRVAPFVEAGGTIYFAGQDGVTGRELWKTNRTPAGTGLVADIGGGTASANPIKLFDADGLSYFWAAHGRLGGGIWRTDGTAAGTIFLMQTSDGDVEHLGQIGDVVFFRAAGPVHGSELWRTDGTLAGTKLVKDIVPGFAGPNIDHGAVLNGSLYFGANINGQSQLWKSDGTEAGTVKAMDVNGQLFDLASNGNRLLLAYNGTLYQSNGTAAGTTVLAGAGPGSNYLDARQLTPTDKGTFFTGRNSSGTRIWLTDGTSAGTRSIGSGYTDAVILEYVDGILYFAANDGVHGQELWRTDGTDAGTFMLADAKAGAAGQFISDRSLEGWMAYGDLLLVQLTNANNERQLWRSDGTVGGTFMLPLPGTTSMRSFQPSMAVVGELAYVGDTGDPLDLRGRTWSTDGTIDGTNIVSWEPFDDELTNPGEFMSVNGDLVFAATHPVIGRELYKLDVPHVLTVTGTAGDDHWVLRDHTNGFLGLWSNNKPTSEPPDFRWDPIDIAALRFEGLAGNDTLVIGGDTYFPVHFDGGEGTDRLAASAITHPVRGNFDGLDVSQGADLLLAGDLALERLTLSGGGRVTLMDGDAPMTLRTRTLHIATAAGSAIDLSDNTLVVEGGDAAAIDALLASARNAPAGRWKGPGITSLTAANGSPLTGLAANQVGDDVIVKYSYNGDANLDGRVNADDYFRIDQGFLAQPQEPLFAQGDFNYDGRVNADDYFLLDQAFLGQGAAASAWELGMSASAGTQQGPQRTRLRAEPVWNPPPAAAAAATTTSRRSTRAGSARRAR